MEQPEADVPKCNEASLGTAVQSECGKDCSVAENNKGPFNDPVYKELSRINGIINKLTKMQLISKLDELHLETRGTTGVLKKRLKTYYKEKKLDQTHANKQKNPNCPYKYLCVVDFEATCDTGTNYPHEIIEFPALLLDTAEKSIVAEFHEYCRPVLNSQLSEFCTSLTGISQETVDKADIFHDVLNSFIRWLRHYGLGDGNSFAIVTDGSFDMGQFLVMQCNYSDIPFPDFGKKWINIRRSYSNFYKTKRLSLTLMLENLGMVFEGRKHCGRDDAHNIARIVIQMLNDGANLKVNERLKWNSLPSKFAEDGYYRGAVPEGGDSHEVSHNRSDRLIKNKSALEVVESKNLDQATPEAGDSYQDSNNASDDESTEVAHACSSFNQLCIHSSS